MTKEKILEAVNKMPNDFDLDVFLEKLIFIDKVEKGLEQLDSGKTITHQQVKEQIKKW